MRAAVARQAFYVLASEKLSLEGLGATTTT